MKKLFSLLAVCLVVLASCEREPIIVLSENSLEFDAAGGSRTIMVTSNYEWSASADNASVNPVSVSPQSGLGSGYVTITMAANTTDAVITKDIVFSCSSKSSTAMSTLHITQACPAGTATLDIEDIEPFDDQKMAAEGAVISFVVAANASWTLVCDASDVVIEPASGTSGKTAVKATVPTCPVFEGRDVKFTLSCSTSAGGMTEEVSIKQAGGIVIYGDEVYHAMLMKDGKWWMKENLRYIPSGMTPSDDASSVNSGIWYPLVIDELTPDKATVKFSKDAADIKANGYLYSSEVAFGVKPGDITVDNAGSFEGTQGICPAGWHIPTKADIVGLVGKTADKNDTNPAAPYYDAELSGGNGSAAKLNADGFNALAWGAVSIANAAAVKGTTMGAIKAYQGGMNTGYIAGSSLRQVTTNDDGSLKNVQYVGLMPNMNTGTYNGAWNNYRNGVSVRCVKNN